MCPQELRFQRLRSATRPPKLVWSSSAPRRGHPWLVATNDLPQTARLSRAEPEPDWHRVRTVPIVTLLGNCKTQIHEGMKRTVQVNVKMSPEDFQLLKKAAEKKWPDAVMTNSGIMFGPSEAFSQADSAPGQDVGQPIRMSESGFYTPS